MENIALVENLKKRVSELSEAIKSGATDTEKANLIIEWAELIIESIEVQLAYQELGGEVTEDLPSRKELQTLQDMIKVTKANIRETSEVR